MLNMIGKAITTVVVFFCIAGVYELSKPIPEETEQVEEIVVQPLYPVQLEADFCHSMIPSLTLKISSRNFLKTIMPGNELEWDYTIDKLVYFRNEPDPIGFCMTLYNEDCEPEVIMVHRKRSYIHSHYRDQVRFVDGGTFEDIQNIVASLSDNSMHYQNHMDIEIAHDYSAFPKPQPQRAKDNNSKESWLEAFAIVSGVSRDMKEIIKPAVTGMTEAAREVRK